MSSERRTVRPFSGIDTRLERSLEKAVLSYGDLECEAGASVLVTTEYARRVPTLRWCSDDDFDDFKRNVRLGATESGFDPALLTFIVTARSPLLKTCEIVLCHPVSGCHDLSNPSRIGERTDGTRWDAFLADSHGAFVDAYVALTRDVNVSSERPLRPSRAGTWLAHVRFRLRCDSDAELFRPLPLDDEHRKELNVPKGTVSFTEIDDDVADPSAGVELARFWVDEALLEAINAQARSPQAAHLQRQLMATFLSDVVAAYATRGSNPDDPENYEDLKESLIGRVARLLADRSKPRRDRDDVLRLCRQGSRQGRLTGAGRVCPAFDGTQVAGGTGVAMHLHVPLDACRRIARQRMQDRADSEERFINNLDSDVRPACREVGEGMTLDMTALEAARSEIESLLPTDGTRPDVDRIEGRASVVLYRAISDSGADVTALDDPGFWRYVSLAHLWNFALWREPSFRSQQISLDEPATSRGTYEQYVDGRNFFNCVATRMYLRVKCLGGLDHDGLAWAVTRGTDFWRSHILRVKLGEHPAFVRAVVRRQADATTRLDTGPLREFAKQLNRSLVNIVPAMLDEDAADAMVGELWTRQLQ